MSHRRCLAITTLLVTLTPALAAADTARLGKPKVTRGDKYIVDFSLAQVAPDPVATGRGGLGDKEALHIKGCQDAPEGPEAGWQGRSIDVAPGMTLQVTQVEDAGMSGRGWPGAHCGYRIADAADAGKFAELPLARTPAFSSPTAILRVGDVVYVDMFFNGYAREHKQAANLVVALDLVTHAELWRTRPLTSNSAMLIVGDSLITGYGFTSEKDALFVFDLHTGKQTQKFPLPKSPGPMVQTAGAVFVQLYDGYAKFPLTMVPVKARAR